MTGPSSLPAPGLAATDEVQSELVRQETAGGPGPAHLAHLLPHHQVRAGPRHPRLRTVVHAALTPGKPRLHNDQETPRAIFRTR